MGDWIRSLAHDGQLRWIGPEKGAIHLGKFSNNMLIMTNFGKKLVFQIYFSIIQGTISFRSQRNRHHTFRNPARKFILSEYMMLVEFRMPP